MTVNTVHVRASRAAIINALRKIPEAAEGDPARQLMIRLGMTALSNIKRAFVVKARGGTDESGLSWLPLKRSSIAYGRRHPGVLWPGKARAPFAPSWMLTDKQRKRWWQYNAIGGAAFAWNRIKAEGGRTLIGEYGDTKVDILRDTGLLLNSLSPGVPGSVQDQVFRIGHGEVVVGTSRRFAGVQHRGIPGKIPQRRLWPSPSDWPESWWNDIVSEAKDGLIEIILLLLRRA